SSDVCSSDLENLLHRHPLEGAGRGADDEVGEQEVTGPEAGIATVESEAEREREELSQELAAFAAHVHLRVPLARHSRIEVVLEQRLRGDRLVEDRQILQESERIAEREELAAERAPDHEVASVLTGSEALFPVLQQIAARLASGGALFAPLRLREGGELARIERTFLVALLEVVAEIHGPVVPRELRALTPGGLFLHGATVHHALHHGVGGDEELGSGGV